MAMMTVMMMMMMMVVVVIVMVLCVRVGVHLPSSALAASHSGFVIQLKWDAHYVWPCPMQSHSPSPGVREMPSLRVVLVGFTLATGASGPGGTRTRAARSTMMQAEPKSVPGLFVRISIH